MSSDIFLCRTAFFIYMDLLHLFNGQSGEVLSFHLPSVTVHTLRALGVGVGERITLLHRSLFNGSVMLALTDKKIVLGKDIAEKIEVKKV